jgi:predicted O-methyltransferase YrrM
MERFGHRGSFEFVSGDSHMTIPAFSEGNPDLTIDMITVDGDHPHDGAPADLRAVIPHLSLGGALVFDDIAHPDHPCLVDVWRHAVAEDGGLRAIELPELGYGGAVAVRQRPARQRPSLKAEAATRLRDAKRAIERYAR